MRGEFRLKNASTILARLSASRPCRVAQTFLSVYPGAPTRWHRHSCLCTQALLHRQECLCYLVPPLRTIRPLPHHADHQFRRWRRRRRAGIDKTSSLSIATHCYSLLLIAPHCSSHVLLIATHGEEHIKKSLKTQGSCSSLLLTTFWGDGEQ